MARQVFRGAVYQLGKACGNWVGRGRKIPERAVRGGFAGARDRFSKWNQTGSAASVSRSQRGEGGVVLREYRFMRYAEGFAGLLGGWSGSAGFELGGEALFVGSLDDDAWLGSTQRGHWRTTAAKAPPVAACRPCRVGC